MPKFVVVLHKTETQDKDAYFTPQNEVVPYDRQGTWFNFDEAQKAAQRARLQDPLNRRVTVKEYGAA